jgi:hypothetical protein
LAMSGIQFKMQQRIIHKLEIAGATSIDRAVTVEEASMDMAEESWLNYFAGDHLGKIKKTANNRYYTEALY